MSLKHFLHLALLSVALAAAPSARSTSFSDPLWAAAPLVSASAAHLMATASVGTHAVAVGLRGLARYSDDGGRTWQQGRVPVSVDLVAVQMLTAQVGWAVGHRGVVLRTDDGGRTWLRQLDGPALRDLMVAAGMKPDDKQQTWPLLDVAFENERVGYAVGGFGLLIRSEDGGRTWQWAGAQLNNPSGLHLYKVRAVGGRWYIAGEKGLIAGTPPGSEQFETLPSPYRGSFFGLVVADHRVLVYGMRGNAYLSHDEGRSWKALETGTQSGLIDGELLPNGDVVLLGQAGEIRISTGRNSGSLLQYQAPPAPYTALTVVDDGSTLLLCGPGGVLRFRLAEAAER